MKLWKRPVTTAFAVALTIAACSTDDLFDLEGVLGVDDGASEGAKESVKVDGSSEARLSLDTGATLTVPKDAVEHSVEIAIERPADAKAVGLVKTLPATKAVSSAPYVLTPHGTTFNKEVTLELPVAKNKDRELVVAWLKDENDRDWKVLGDAKVRGDVAVVTLKHFSVVVLLERETAGLAMDVPADGEDAGEPADAGAAQGDTRDAGTTTSDPTDGVPNAGGGTSVWDAGLAGGALDASVQPRADAGEPKPEPDAGSTQASDAGTGGAELDASATLPDAALPEPPDASATAPDADPNGDSGGATCEPFVCQPYECGLVPDGCGYFNDCGTCSDSGATCVPVVCQSNECGSVPDGCGAYIECGTCDSGVCGLYEPNQCGQPI